MDQGFSGSALKRELYTLDLRIGSTIETGALVRSCRTKRGSVWNGLKAYTLR
jgi:hypothetical protein